MLGPKKWTRKKAAKESETTFTYERKVTLEENNNDEIDEVYDEDFDEYEDDFETFEVSQKK